NRMILGDSLLVMTSLAEKERLKGKVQTIYLDPPYGIEFRSNWQVSTRKRDVKESRSEDVTRQPEQVKAFRDTWQYGINSYLSYLRDRFAVCRDLLSESGSIFVQIGEANSHLVRSIMDEVMGSDNFVVSIVLKKTPSHEGKLMEAINDYILWYAKNKELIKFRTLYEEWDSSNLSETKFREVWLESGLERRLSSEEIEKTSLLPAGSRFFRDDVALTSEGESSRGQVQFAFEGRAFTPGMGRHWRSGDDTSRLERLGKGGRLQPGRDRLFFKLYHDDFPLSERLNMWLDLTGAQHKVYVVQTNPRAIERCVLMTTDPGDLVLDPTCGSGTTAYVAEQRGRRWITIDTSRVALALARTRLMSAKYPYYHLADSNGGIMKEAEVSGKLPPQSSLKTEGDIKKGFVYKRVPHVTLKSIANNEEIDAIHAKWQVKLEPVKAELNKALKQKWEEWEIPREPDEKWSENVKQLHSEWWNLRRQRQNEIDESISRHADTELLYDQPYEDNKKIRVTGPFTVESLSPHRVLSTADKNLDGTVSEREAKEQQDFVSMILDQLRKAGVQNTYKNERLKFDRLDSFAGVWLHGSGEYTENGKSRRVAVSIGPEHGTVGPELLKEAAKEAVQGVGFDLLIVCGFAFDPHVSEEAKRYGKLTVLTARMNPDLAMGDELLKKTGSGNLFMVFGEPDMEVKKQKDNKIQIVIKGLDVYDPTTGQIRSSTTDDIACWFIDTNYNGESFFVRHAYFTGGDEPYEKLKRALRAEIDEAAWSALYSTKSRAFDSPETGKIAVKVINHYGDEVLKVFEVK
ncbi:MAG TPA: site-specific DNA-methyltransferase, partial [Bacteroidota bacterium]|nr:site-specific DNA-methyltransferase [Bacteroidota bacterium]